MKTSKIIILALTSALAVACNQQPNNSANNTGKTQEEANSTKENVSANISFKDPATNEAFIHYNELKNALTADDVSGAQKHAVVLSKKLENVEGCEPTAITAQKISAAKTIEEQRAAFILLNKDLISYFKEAPVQSGTAYVAYCPMADDNKGAYWLSTVKEIKNPYYGKEMMTCGEVKETIN